MIELHLYMIERWGGLHAYSETTGYSASTALGLEWIFANTKK